MNSFHWVTSVIATVIPTAAAAAAFVIIVIGAVSSVDFVSIVSFSCSLCVCANVACECNFSV